MLRTYEAKRPFDKEKIFQFVTALDLIKCLIKKRIKKQKLPPTCALISELIISSINTMMNDGSCGWTRNSRNCGPTLNPAWLIVDRP